jgi:subtilisin family serine protease
MPSVRLRLQDLAPRTGRGVRIAVIDSGVHAAHPHVQGVSGGVGIDAAGLVHDDYVDRLGHGTAVTAVLREKAPGAEILVVKIFDRELRATGDQLVAALGWARHAGARLINLSLGTVNPAHEAALATAVADLKTTGADVLCAAPVEAERWLPGALDGVVAVTMDMTLPRDQCDVERESGGSVIVRASGYPRPIPGVPPERNLKGVSFAVANATGLIACALEGSRPGASLAAVLGVSSTSPSA